MISEPDLNPEGLIFTPEQRANFPRLLWACNQLEREYIADGGEPLHIDRGVSSPADQARIDPAHPNDAHVKAAGVDFADWSHKFYAWCAAHLDVLERLGLWMESIVTAPNHVHLQTYPPASGRRIFLA